MELAYRKGPDAYVPTGAYRELEGRLRARAAELAVMPAVVVSCFDRNTRLLPFSLYDKMIFPAAARSVAGAVHQAGFRQTRAVFELWNPYFRPSQVRFDGKLPQLLLVSTMQMHAARAYDFVRDAWKLGDDRPLIVVGGPKAFHEPFHFWPLQTPSGPVGPDVAVTGEAYVLLDMLNVVVQFHRQGETLRTAFERARQTGALDTVPGLVYLAPDATWQDPVLVDTGLQRLVQDLDELPDDVTGLSLLEPPHRRAGLSPAPLPDHKVRRYARIVSLQMTQGCKFTCPYCPIPALNQKTWRYRSPEGLARQFKAMRERYRLKYFFGADDNFFNRRQTSEVILEELARTTLDDGTRLGDKIRWGTEATQHDTWKNRDLLPLARRAGMSGIWFGIEDLTAELINKGQKPEVTIELFKLMHRVKINPMAMMMYHSGQPFKTRNSLYGLANQMEFLRKAGAISVQCTLHIPAVGTREYEKTYATGRVIERLGSFKITEAHNDGNYVIVTGDEPPWRKHLSFLAGYLSFYNPVNFWRALRDDGSPLRKYRAIYQLAGFVAAVRHAWRLLPYTLRLLWHKPTFFTSAPPCTHVPIRQVAGAFSRFPDGAPQPPAEIEDHEPAAAA